MKSTIGFNSVIDKNVYIGENVVIGDNVRIMWGAWIGDNVEIGDGTLIYPNSVIGSPAEHKSATPPLNAGVKIGKSCVIREFVTINSSTLSDKTEIMDNCYFMTKSHVGHDCKVYDNVVLCPGSKLGGHSVVDSFTYIGMNSCTHQMSKIGKYCMVGAQAFFKGESPDAITWAGVPAKPVKVNSRSLEKNISDSFEILKMINSAKEFIKSREQ